MGGAASLYPRFLRCYFLKVLKLPSFCNVLFRNSLIFFWQPVRAELMQALWRTLRNPSEDIAHVAFRVLGKFGGSNRKMLKEAQRLAFDQSNSVGPCLKVVFDGLKNPVHLPVRARFSRFYAIQFVNFVKYAGH